MEGKKPYYKSSQIRRKHKSQGNVFLLRSYNAHIIVNSEGNAFQYHTYYIHNVYMYPIRVRV